MILISGELPSVLSDNPVSVDVDTTPASDIQSQPVRWLYESYIPLGTVTILIGDGGEGKSFYTLALAAAISNGALLPGAEKPFPASDVIIMNAENPWPSVIKPRLEMLGADCGRIHRINDAGNRITLTDPRIESAIRKHGVKLTVIDPIQSHLPLSMSMGRAESVRPMLTHLEHVAERTQSAILLVGHVTKGRGKTNHRGLGSVDIVNSVPSVLYLGRAEGLDRDVRAVAHGKSNFSELADTQIFRLNKKDGFQWLGESDVSPEDIMNFNASRAREDKSKIGEAVDFLSELLSEGSVPATEAIELADEAGISKRTLLRAKEAVGADSKRVDGHWIWSL
jgi:predicted ATP-dependent serine protease